MSRQYLFVGDTHGDMSFITRAIKIAQQHGAEIVQAGDWGYLWPGSSKLNELSALLVDHEVTMRFIDGNHDDHPQLRKHVKACETTGIAPRVLYQPRGSVHEDVDGTRFLFCGGAPSIDRFFRTQGRSWWPEEVISREDLARALTVPGIIHVVVTHDAPAFPPGFLPKGTGDFKRQQRLSMQYVDDIVQHHLPGMLVHGHWHARYSRMHAVNTQIIGLACNNDPIEDAVLLWSRPKDGMA